MNLTRAVLTGILLWVLIFFEVSILLFGFNLEGIAYNIIHYVFVILFVIVSTSFYFKDTATKTKKSEGFFLGIIYVIVGLLLDAAITIPLFVKEYGFFLNPSLLFGLLITILVTSIMGVMKR